MARPIPPMYGKVRKKVPPPQRQIVVQPKPTPEELAEREEARQAAEKKAKSDAAKAEKARAKEEKAKAKAAKKAPAAKKAAASSNFPKWSPDDTRDKLYKIAKKLDLGVNSRDTKDWLIKQLKKAEKKAG